MVISSWNEKSRPFWLGGSLCLLADFCLTLSVPDLLLCQPNRKKVLKDENLNNNDDKDEQAGKNGRHTLST
jgi:hypothetical protein